MTVKIERSACRLAALLVVIVLLLGCEGRPRQFFGGGDPDEQKYGSGTLLEIDLTNGAPESLSGGGLFRASVSKTYPALVRTLERAAREQNADGVFVRLGMFRFNWAQAEELGRLLQALRKQKLPVVCHAHSYGNTSVLLAAQGCDRIWVSPAGDVDVVGIASQNIYLRALLDRLDVQADFLHMGKYKSAVESITHEGPTDASKESLMAVLKSLRQTWLAGLKRGRPEKDIVNRAESGPFSPNEAKRHGFVDEVGYESEAREDAKKRAGAGEVEVAFGHKSSDGSKELAELLRLIAGSAHDEGREPRIVVIPAEGSINMQSGGPLSSGGISYRALSKVIRRIAKDESVKAVVLRIDSPGGSALASDLLWHDLMELRKKKPLVASVGSMAASGGYYMASAANRIITEQSSIVGSIGVFGGKLVFSGALSQVGVNTVTFAASDEPGAENRAAYLSALTPWDDATRERVRSQMRSVYDLFVSRVAEGRGLDGAAVRKVAEGRIWSGTQGQTHKLVDESGGLATAITRARELGDLPDDAPVYVEGAGESLLEMLMLDERADEATLARALSRYQSQVALLDRLAPQLRVFASTLQPLAAGEKIVAALPLAVSFQ